MAHRRGPSARILIAGDVDDLATIEHVLTHVAADAYGQLFVEAISEADILPLEVPERVTVTWLLRSRQPGSVSGLVFAERGELLSQAICAWTSEWMPGASDRETTLMWIGADGCSRIGALVERLHYDIAQAADARVEASASGEQL